MSNGTIVTSARLEKVLDDLPNHVSLFFQAVLDYIKGDEQRRREFTPVIEQLLAFHPKDRQVMLFSATFPLIVKSFKVSNFSTVSFAF